MLAGVSRVITLASLLSVAGCSIGLSGLESDAGGAEDGSSTTMPPNADSGVMSHGTGPSTGDAASAAEGGGGSPPPCGGPGNPCTAVPAGWALVAFASAQSSPCPPGFDSAPASDLVEGAAPGASACTCGACGVTTPPSCASGAVAGYFDYSATAAAGTCYLPDTMPLLSNDPPGACLSDVHQGGYTTFDVRYNAPAPTGGVCSTPGVPNAAALTYGAHDRVCAANDVAAMNCSGTSCDPNLTAPYEACIAAPGNVACPPGPYTVAHAVGFSGSFDCADCACKITSTCSGTLTLYSDANCQKGAYPIATGVCVDVTSAASFETYQYKANAPTKVSCQAGAAGAPQNVALADPETVCCAK
jgi:hypothetical protein